MKRIIACFLAVIMLTAFFAVVPAAASFDNTAKIAVNSNDLKNPITNTLESKQIRETDSNRIILTLLLRLFFISLFWALAVFLVVRRYKKKNGLLKHDKKHDKNHNENRESEQE